MGNFLLQLRDLLPLLPVSEKKVADFILDNPSNISAISIDKMAGICHTSPATIFRLCKRLGATGYRDFSRQIISDVASSPTPNNDYQDIVPNDSMLEIAQKVCVTNSLAIENTLQLLDEAELEKAVATLYEAKRVDFYGIGTSGLAALDAHYKFLRIRKMTYATTDPHQQLLSAYSLSAGDVAFIISYSGETTDILETAQVAKNAGAIIISLTRSRPNSLSSLADIVLHSYDAEPLIRSGPKSSRIAQLTVIDILYTCYASKHFDDVHLHLDNTRYLVRRKSNSPSE